MRQSSFERIGDHEIALAARKGLDQEVACGRQHGEMLLQLQPFADLRRQGFPGTRIGQHLPHALRQPGGERKLAAGIGGHFRRVRACPRHQSLVLDDALQGEDFAAEEKGVARRQRLEEIFLDLAKHTSTAHQGAGIGRARLFTLQACRIPKAAGTRGR